MASSLEDVDLERKHLYQQLDSYPWNDDEDFQNGLFAILGPVQDPSQIEHLTLRAKCYYYARRFNTPVDFDGYKAYLQNEHAPTVNGTSILANDINNGDVLPQGVEPDVSSGGFDEAPKPATFAEICDMIAEGKPIPGIKDIPDTVLEGEASESQATKRKKPWETDHTSDKPSWMT